jgi:hypothetical protein
MALKVGGTFQFISCHCIRVQWEEPCSEVGVEVVPIDKMGASDVCGNHFPVAHSVSPFLGSSLIHIGHCSLNLCLFVRKIVRTQAEVSLTGIEETSAFVTVSIEVWGRGGLQVCFRFCHRRGVAVGSVPLWFCVIVVSNCRVLFRAASICTFCVCWFASLVSISASRSLVLSEGRSIFSEAGEGISSGVTAISLDNEAGNARSRK